MKGGSICQFVNCESGWGCPCTNADLGSAEEEELCEYIDWMRSNGKSVATVSRWETGEAVPITARLSTLADVLHCTIDELFGRTGPPSAQAG